MLIDAETDGNNRLRRMYYSDAPPAYRGFRLGRAVAASSCVPGLFAPIALPGLYPDRTVRLVDGGVHDNQGIAGLLEQECNVLLVSDASGQSEVQADPAKEWLGVLYRADNILMARVRQAECDDLKARRRAGLLRGLMLVHLKKDLWVDPVDWIDCPDPHGASEEARPAELRGPLTSYGVAKEIQRRLAALRTDLDSFSDLEALALMASAYAMTAYEFPRGVPGFPHPDAGSISWPFQLALDSWMKSPVSGNDERLRLLDVGRNQAFKLWRVDFALKMVAGMIGIALLACAIWACVSWWFTSVLTVGSIAVSAVTAVIGIVFGATMTRVLNFPRRLTVGLGASVAGWLAVKIHLTWIDRWFLQRGRLHLRHDQTLAWIVANRVWRKVKKTGRVYVRAPLARRTEQAVPVDQRHPAAEPRRRSPMRCGRRGVV